MAANLSMALERVSDNLMEKINLAVERSAYAFDSPEVRSNVRDWFGDEVWDQFLEWYESGDE